MTNGNRGVQNTYQALGTSHMGSDHRRRNKKNQETGSVRVNGDEDRTERPARAVGNGAKRGMERRRAAKERHLQYKGQKKG